MLVTLIHQHNRTIMIFNPIYCCDTLHYINLFETLFHIISHCSSQKQGLPIHEKL